LPSAGFSWADSFSAECRVFVGRFILCRVQGFVGRFILC
jgi:hypothetical protein